jgi:hypothetical protein
MGIMQHVGMYVPFSLSGSVDEAPHNPRSLYGSILEYRVVNRSKFSLSKSVLKIYWNALYAQRLPLWPSGQSSWLQNGDELCFL